MFKLRQSGDREDRSGSTGDFLLFPVPKIDDAERAIPFKEKRDFCRVVTKRLQYCRYSHGQADRVLPSPEHSAEFSTKHWSREQSPQKTDDSLSRHHEQSFQPASRSPGVNQMRHRQREYQSEARREPVVHPLDHHKLLFGKQTETPPTNPIRYRERSGSRWAQ